MGGAAEAGGCGIRSGCGEGKPSAFDPGNHPSDFPHLSPLHSTVSHFFGCSFKQPTNRRINRPTLRALRPCDHTSPFPCNDHVPECPLKTENDQNPSAAPPPSEVSRDTIAICARSQITSLHMRSSPDYSTADHAKVRLFLLWTAFCGHYSKRCVPSSRYARPWKGGGGGLFFFAGGGNQLGAVVVVQQAVTLLAGLRSH